jgi:hypothetical protein
MIIVNRGMGTDDAGAELRESSQSLDPLYLAAAVPFLLLTLAALFYDSAGLYFAAVVLCVAQFVRPTRVGWILITGAYALVTCLFVYGFAYDVVSLGRERSRQCHWTRRPDLSVNEWPANIRTLERS